MSDICTPPCQGIYKHTFFKSIADWVYDVNFGIGVCAFGTKKIKIIIHFRESIFSE